MLEILITLVIIAIALLGTAGLQISAMRMGKSSEFRNLAVFLASDISERMEANKAGAVAGNYLVNSAGAVSGVAGANCSTSACDAQTLASWDVAQWQSSLTALPQASWSISAPGGIAANPITYTITINWIDRKPDQNATTGEHFSVTAARTISN